MKVTVAVFDKHSGNAVERVLSMLDELSLRHQPMHYGVVTPKKGIFDKNTELLSKQASESPCALGYVSSRSRAASGYDTLQLDDASVFFEGRVYEPVPAAKLIEHVNSSPTHCEASLQTLIKETDGDYAFWMLKDSWVAAGRDPVGVQPLYFGENIDIAAYATNRTALWKLGIEDPQSFPPGALALAGKDGFAFQPVKLLTYPHPKVLTLDEAADALYPILLESLQRRLRGLKEIAVAFSGGLDSSVIAYLTSRVGGVKVTLLHVSLENQSETEEAIEAAEALDLPMQVHLYKDSDVEAALPRVVELIEEADPVKAAIGVPFYWAAEKACEGKFRAMLAGQGADELFGGYQRYVTEYCQGDTERAARMMFSDVVNIHQSNLERDLKLTGFFDVELRLPFASYDVAAFALGLPMECRMEKKQDTLRKLVLRKLARNVGVPPAIADKPKKAVQYSTGINDAVKRIAKKQGKTVGEYVSELFEKSKSV